MTEKPNAWIFLAVIVVVLWFQLGAFIVLLVLGVYAFLYVRPHRVLNRHEHVSRNESSSGLNVFKRFENASLNLNLNRNDRR